MLSIRPAAVAGTFYPADKATLQSQVQACLGETPTSGSGAPPKLLVVPHAGYIYSGPIAGHAYARLAPWAAKIRRVVLLGPAHRVALRGLAMPTVDAFETPLGRVRIDQEARAALAGLAQVVADDRAHALEHALEVQLPFLQTVLGSSFTLLPLAVGNAGAGEVAEVIERLWGGDETLIVVSSDLSHYLPYDDARATDRTTAARIAALATDIDPHEACGAHALNGALAAARQHGLQAELLDLRNSGDTAGDRRRVVGYAALSLTAPIEDTTAADDEARLGAALLSRARNSIAAALGLARQPEPQHPALATAGATFVTLHDARGELRGCIGRLEAVASLEDDVRRNAVAAAFDDPRFDPLQAHEWQHLRVEVSLLEAPEPLPAGRTRVEALRHLRPHVDGVILEWRGRRATFLPQVWQQLPEPQDFIAALLRKAGLAADFWADDLRLHRYRVRHFQSAAAMEPA
jgi:AmmeMemoRadiSam system protein B/AmmeMemoRadiSam system protein A